MTDVFITALGAFLPGPPVGNDEMEDYLGRVHGRPSRARARTLAGNGIQTRHYAIDKQQRTLFRNSEMAALAVKQALARGGRSLADVPLLAAATTAGDLLVPGFASMVHGELGNPACEIASLHGVCAAGAMALQRAYLGVRIGDQPRAVACASELPSRLFKASRYQDQIGPDGALPFDTEFLRWMLSDGAGAALLEDRPASRGLSLRIDWIEVVSHADRFPVCMYAGANKGRDGSLGPGWLDYPSFQAAAGEGALNLKQDIRLLDQVIELGVARLFQLIEAGRVDPKALDWIVCHYSSEFFKGRIFELLARGGLHLPPERWFSNLTSKGNVGSAALFVLLEELWASDRLRPGQTILVNIPESGRFSVAYAHLTVVGEAAAVPAALLEAPAAPAPSPSPLALATGDPVVERLVRRLGLVWVDFQAALQAVPIVQRLEQGHLTLDDYKLLLLNLRQQVVEGARWIARAASQVEIEAFPVRSLFIQHAGDEHRDFRMLERDYQSVGGPLEEITRADKNVGSEALSAFMFHRAGQSNPLDLLGAMFIIEGLGARLARRWGEQIRDQLGLRDDQVSFLLYHGGNDDNHLDRLEQVVASGLIDEALAARIVKTARVTARLYRLQLEELGEHLMQKPGPPDVPADDGPPDFVARLGQIPHDLRDPDPWLALHLDPSLPFDPQAKAALILDARSFSRRFMLPLVRPIARTFIVLFALFRLLVPRALASSRLLHWMIYAGLRTFVSPAANFLILRHFQLGSQLVSFIAANAPVKVPTSALRPLALSDVKDDLFLRHDLNLYNFLIHLNGALGAVGRSLGAPARVDFDPIIDVPIPFQRFPDRWTNFLDLFSAIEIYTPLYELLLTQRDFNRANHSLQLDETMAIYAAQILGDPTHLGLVNNRHPLVPLSALRAGFRLVIHGLGTEVLHAVLVRHKRARAGGGATRGPLGLAGLWTTPPSGGGRGDAN